MSRPVVIQGDARALPLPDASVDAIVCDPPYALGFMGKEWDSFGDTGRGARARTERAAEVTPTGRGHSTSAGPYLAAGVDSLRSAGKPFQRWCEEWATEALRVLRPGGHLLAFGGTRTYHRLACAIEDAGFEIRDSIGCAGWLLAWNYASGFPKSLAVGRAVDGEVCTLPGKHLLNARPDMKPDEHVCPLSPEGDPWRGHGTAAKPAWEPIVVARKPLTGTVAQTILRYGTGAINVGATRVESGPPRNPGFVNPAPGGRPMMATGNEKKVGYESPAGRWPTNLVLLHAPSCEDGGECHPQCHVAEMDRQGGNRPVGGRFTGKQGDRGSIGGTTTRQAGDMVGYGDCGSASRFFPVFRFEPKADTWERPTIVREGAGEGRTTLVNGRKSRRCNVCGSRANDANAGEPSCGHGDWEWAPEVADKRADVLSWPTVKPVDLMRWLIRLVMPPGGRGLDMFAGTGSTGQAAQLEGFDWILVEQDPDALRLIAERLSWPVRIDRDGKFERIKPKVAADLYDGDLFSELGA